MNLIIEILKAIVLGVVEGITEWLPISSTGHMILVDEFLHLNVTPQFKEMFLVVIQLGAILAVVVLYWHKLWPFGIENKRIVPKKDIWQMWFKVLVSCVPAAVVGVLFDDKLNALFYNWQTVAIMLILFGVFFLVVETWNKGKTAKIHSIGELTYTSALIIGAFQLIAAVFPGTSRAALPFWVPFSLACPVRWRQSTPSFGGAGDVRCQCAEAGQVRLPLFLCRGHLAGRGYDCGFCSVHFDHQVPDGVY